MIAVSVGTEWVPTKLVAKSKLRPLSDRQSNTYIAVRTGRWKWTNDKPLPSLSETAKVTEMLG